TEKMAEEEKIAKSFYSDCQVKSVVRIGNIFDDIGQAADEIGANLIIMGTHGASGWQKVVGSHALKVITNSSVPFIVVQKQIMRPSVYDNIVVPLDLHNETKQKLEIVSSMANYFKSKVHLISPYESDEFLLHKLKANIAWGKKYLSSKGVKSDAHIGAKGANFIDEILNLTSDVDADLISIMNLQKNSLMGMLGSAYEQSLITNELQTPVLCVNPLTTTVSSGSILVR
ncbi:universal stress protein, partial [Flavobacteriales bacterium]|nr:universal stress protein [Flavobacteriales bacterium]